MPDVTKVGSVVGAAVAPAVPADSGAPNVDAGVGVPSGHSSGDVVDTTATGRTPTGDRVGPDRGSSLAELVAGARALAQESIAEARATIARLEGEIATLEGSHATRQVEIEQTIGQIEARKREIERARDSKRNIGILGALFGVPWVSVVSLVQMQNDDARIRELNTRLASLRQSQSEANGRVAQYQRTAEALRGKLGALRREETGLAAVADAPVPAAARNFARVAEAAQQLEQRHALMRNLQQQADLLSEMRDAAQAAGAPLAALLERARTAADEAARLTADSVRELDAAVRFFAKKDPNHAALGWLADSVAAKLVRKAIPGESAVERELRTQLHKQLAAIIAGRGVGPGADDEARP